MKPQPGDRIYAIHDIRITSSGSSFGSYEGTFVDYLGDGKFFIIMRDKDINTFPINWTMVLPANEYTPVRTKDLDAFLDGYAKALE